MKAWFESRFNTEQRARETIAVGVTLAAFAAFAVVLVGVGLGR